MTDYKNYLDNGIYDIEGGKYKDAIEKIFNVKVEKVNTVNVHAKKKRVGRYTGMTNKYKKAIVTLANGNKIDF